MLECRPSLKAGETMGDSLRVIGRSFRDWWDEMFVFVGVNLLWAVLAIPIVTIFPATMGAYYITYEKAHGRRIEFDFFWQGFRQYFGKSWALGAINTIITFLLIVNILFYLQQPNWLFYLTILWIYIAILWLGVQLYVFPLTIEQEDKSIKLIYRNAALVAMSRPLFTLIIALLQLVILAISIVLSPLLLLVYIPLSGLIGNHALISALEHIEERQARAKEKKEEDRSGDQN